MEWTVFALLQMAIIAVGLAFALWLRNRTLSHQNATLRDALDAQRIDLESQQDEEAIARTWVKTRLDALDPDDLLTPVTRIVLEQQLTPHEDFRESLQSLLSSQNAPDDDAYDDVESLDTNLDVADETVIDEPIDANPDRSIVAVLEAQLEEALAELNSLKSHEAETSPEELKALLQQFTRDSREMMSCIQALEKENAQLREQLGITGPARAASQSDAA